ncbi:YopX family protein [Alkalicoccobacillus gibsonii]|uniref:YopX family protein n=1 Tax=Alkalicoccobacillus gibsonii TaxID=79881 RepID=UPI003F7C3313
MGREIKFRAWDNGKMQKVDFNNLYVNRHHPTGTLYLRDENKPFGETHITQLMQYTGLKEADSGREIYEKDILSYEDGEESFTAVVEWSDWGFYLKGIAPNDVFDFADITDRGKVSATIIGNAFTHPHLLEVSDGTDN